MPNLLTLCRPKSGAFQANPPFSEEVMSAMADHMIELLNGTLP